MGERVLPQPCPRLPSSLPIPTRHLRKARGTFPWHSVPATATLEPLQPPPVGTAQSSTMAKLRGWSITGRVGTLSTSFSKGIMS